LIQDATGDGASVSENKTGDNKKGGAENFEESSTDALVGEQDVKKTGTKTAKTSQAKKGSTDNNDDVGTQNLDTEDENTDESKKTVDDEKNKVDTVAAKELSAPDETADGNSGGPKNKGSQKQNEKPAEKEWVAGNGDNLETDDKERGTMKGTSNEPDNKAPQEQNKKADQKQKPAEKATGDANSDLETRKDAPKGTPKGTPKETPKGIPKGTLNKPDNKASQEPNEKADQKQKPAERRRGMHRRKIQRGF
jgi:hypothetical protein